VTAGASRRRGSTATGPASACQVAPPTATRRYVGPSARRRGGI